MKAEFLLLAFLSSCFEIMFQEYMTKDMVLEPYFKLLRKLYHSSKFGKWVSLPLGICPYCHGFWMSVIVYILFYKAFDLQIFLFCAFSFVCIKVISGIIKIIYKHV